MRNKDVVLKTAAAICSIICSLSSCVFVIDARDSKQESESDAAESATAEMIITSSVAVSNPTNIYSVVCKDDKDTPIEGVILKVCSDNLCTLLMTDEHGSALYPASDGKCEICVLSYPEEFILTDDECIVASGEQSEYSFSFTAASTVEPQNEAGVDNISSVTAGALSAEVSNGNVLLKWDRFENADAYRVYMCDENGKNCHSLTRTLDTDYTIKNLALNKTYLFKVASLKKDGGSYSEIEIIGEVKVTTDNISTVNEQPVSTSGITAPVEELTADTLPTWNTYDFAIYDENGRKIMLSDFAGKAVIINVWATWCGYCVDELPVFDQLCDKYSDKVQFIMLNCDGKGYEGEVSSFMQRNKWSFPVYYDYDYNSSRYFGNGIPVTAAINSKGELEALYEGAASDEQLETIVKSLFAGRRNVIGYDADRTFRIGNAEKIRK